MAVAVTLTSSHFWTCLSYWQLLAPNRSWHGNSVLTNTKQSYLHYFTDNEAGGGGGGGLCNERGKENCTSCIFLTPYPSSCDDRNMQIRAIPHTQLDVVWLEQTRSQFVSEQLTWLPQFLPCCSPHPTSAVFHSINYSNGYLHSINVCGCVCVFVFGKGLCRQLQIAWKWLHN